MKRLLPLILTGIMVFAVSCKQAPKAESSKEITIGRSYDATTLDVHNADDDGSYLLIYLMGEGLVRNDDGIISPGVAERWTVSADNKTFTFYLRSDAKWADGSPLNAKDFEYSFKRLINPTLGYKNASDGLDFVKAKDYYNGQASLNEVGVTVINDHTLELKYEEPSVARLFDLARYAFFPIKKDLAEKEGVSYGSEASKVMFNGAFNIDEWLHEDRVVMTKNENYWNKKAINLSKITNKVNIPAATAVDMMLAGEIDVYTYTSITSVNSLKGSGYTVEPIISGYQFTFMNSKGKNPQSGRFMANSNFRRALNYAVNRDGLIASVFPGASPTYRVSAPTMSGVNGLFVDEYPYQGWPTAGDPEKAKQCLTAALRELGATINDVPELSLLCFESQTSMLVMQAVQDMILSTLGLKSRIDPQPIQQMLAKVEKADWDLWWGGKSYGSLDWGDGWAADILNVPTNFYSYMYNSDAYTAKYYQMARAMTIKERKDLLFELEKIFCDDPASILVGWTQNWVLLKEGIEGFVIGPYPNFTFLNITK